MSPVAYQAKQTTTDVTVTTTTETAVAQIDSVSTPGPGYSVSLDGHVDFTTGAGTTAVTLRWRQGSGIAGTLVGETEVPGVSASTRINVDASAVDTPGEIAGQTYTCTIQQTAATGNGTVNKSVVKAHVSA